MVDVMLMTILYFLLALLILITVHEFGHFWVARRCGVKVLTFSFGFGKRLFSWRDKYNTEYAISAFPIGGYVKMLDESEGEVAEDEKHLAFNNQATWKKVAIVLAGPLFNFIFAVIALWLMLVLGIQSIAPIIGAVKPGSIADAAGFKPKYEIIAVENKPVSSLRQFQYRIIPMLGGSSSLEVTVKEGTNKKTLTLDISKWKLNPKNPDLLASLGISPFIPKIPPVVGKVIDGMPAAKAGIIEGDKITAVGDKKIDDWIVLVELVGASPNKSLMFEILRHGQILTLEVTPTIKLVNGNKVGVIGLVSKRTDFAKNWLRTQRLDPIQALTTAFHQTYELSLLTLKMIGRLLTGKISVQAISGPIGIAQGAGQSAQGGLAYYLSFLALVSISLGVLNLLPIPMLDGGHLMFYLVEAILRRPISEEAKTISFNIGLLLIIALMILAMVNDVTRLLG